MFEASRAPSGHGFPPPPRPNAMEKLARRASEGFVVIECPALACASG